MTAHELTHYVATSAPMILRMSFPVLKEIGAHLVHSFGHKGVHLVGHRSHLLGKCFKRCPWLTDLCLIGLGLLFGQMVEGHESGEGHSAE